MPMKIVSEGLSERDRASVERCVAAVDEVYKKLITEHDGRVLFPCLLETVTAIAATLRCANLYDTETLVDLFSFALSDAITRKVEPKILYGIGAEQTAKGKTQ